MGRGCVATDVVAVPAAERCQERLGNDVIGRPVAEPAANVPMDRGGMPIVEFGECLRLMPGLLDQLGAPLPRAGIER